MVICKMAAFMPRPECVNSLRPRPNRWHFADDIFKRIFENENVWISHGISLKFIPKVRINNIPALVQIMAWRRQGDKPLSEPMLVSLTTHICVIRPQWVKLSGRCFSYRDGGMLSNQSEWNIESSLNVWYEVQNLTHGWILHPIKVKKINTH